ncbi:hypothetical protein, partial [Alistipes finegoldii]|uniref:hypothetical protein n=1 Tax=Alistipes finegoldii TaxID=214856 RepID=UPI003A8A24FF
LFYFFTPKSQHKNSKKDFFFRIIPCKTKVRTLRNKQSSGTTTAPIPSVPPQNNPSDSKIEINAKSIRFRFGT